MGTKRDFLKTAGGLAVAGGALAGQIVLAGELGPELLPAGTLSAASLEVLSGKVPLVKKTWRPPNFETPVRYFESEFTPYASVPATGVVFQSRMFPVFSGATAQWVTRFGAAFG